MEISIICVSKKPDTNIQKLCNEYEKRMQHDIKLKWKDISPLSGKMTRLEQRSRESELIMRQLPKNGYIILLDERGQQLDNHELAASLRTWQQLARPVCLVIGGAFGISEALVQRANQVLSLSKLVFPHEFARLLLVEQLYRSTTILKNGNYHHE